MPTAASTVGNAFTEGSSTSTDTNQRPAGSCDAVTVDGKAPSGRGRDHTMSSGSFIFARVRRPSW